MLALITAEGGSLLSREVPALCVCKDILKMSLSSSQYSMFYLIRFLIHFRHKCLFVATCYLSEGNLHVCQVKQLKCGSLCGNPGARSQKIKGCVPEAVF